MNPAASIDFQRLERVRARVSARRKRWVWGIATAVVAALLFAAAPRVVPTASELFASLERSIPIWNGTARVRDEALAEARGRVKMAEARGRVTMIEPKRGIVRVSSGFLGLGSVKLVVTPETLIVVGHKEGGFADILEGENVAVLYEPRSDSLWAKRVEVLAPSTVDRSTR